MGQIGSEPICLSSIRFNSPLTVTNCSRPVSCSCLIPWFKQAFPERSIWLPKEYSANINIPQVSLEVRSFHFTTSRKQVTYFFVLTAINTD